MLTDRAIIEKHIEALKIVLEEFIKEESPNQTQKHRRSKRIRSLKREIHYWEWQLKHPEQRLNNKGEVMENCTNCSSILSRSGKNKKRGIIFKCDKCDKRYIKINGKLTDYIPVPNGRPKTLNSRCW